MNKKRKAKTHDDNRAQICILCLSKCKKRDRFTKILPKGETEKLINVYFEYNAKDWHLPCGLCSLCRLKLYRFKNGARNAIKRPDLSQFTGRKINTRSAKTPANESCDCVLCKFVRTSTKVQPETPVGLNNLQHTGKQSNCMHVILKYDKVSPFYFHRSAH